MYGRKLVIQITSSVIRQKMNELRQTVTVHGERKEASRRISIKGISSMQQGISN